MLLVKPDLHRTLDKTRWVSPKGFSVICKRGASLPVSSRHSIMKDGYAQMGDSIYIETEPYEDPSLNPGFVRSTKEYLKQANQKSVQREIEL